MISFSSHFADQVSVPTFTWPVPRVELISSVTNPCFPIIEYAFVATVSLSSKNFFTSGFVKRIKFEGEIKILNINNVETLENVLKEVEVNE